MPTVICPHCHTEVPHGARVCRGCQAEVEYGTPPAALLFVLLVAFFAAWKTGSVLDSSVAGWIVFALLLGGGIYGCLRLFKNRVSFKRIYRTR